MAIVRRHTKLPSTVESKAGVSVISAGGANVKDILVLVGGATLPEELDSLGTALVTIDRCGMNKAHLQRNLYRPPE